MMDRQKAIKLEIAQQSKQECQVEQPTRNWLDLPSELMGNILYRVGISDILQNAQKVCTAWRKICKDPAMWTVVYIDNFTDPSGELPLDELCKHVVDRSQGQLVDITIVEFGYDKILLYVANRSSQLKRLTVACCDEYMDGIWTESLKKFPLLEELNIYGTYISEDSIETAGRYCPLLKTLKVNKEDYRFWDDYSDEEIDPEIYKSDSIAMAIGENLPALRHLELIGNPMSNEGLEMILDGCHHLELLDLRGCLFIDLTGHLGKRCLQQIKCVKLPDDSLEGCPFIYKNDGRRCDVDDESEGGSDYESEGGYYDEYEEEGGYYDEYEEEYYDEYDEYGGKYYVGGYYGEYVGGSSEESDDE